MRVLLQGKLMWSGVVILCEWWFSTGEKRKYCSEKGEKSLSRTEDVCEIAVFIMHESGEKSPAAHLKAKRNPHDRKCSETRSDSVENNIHKNSAKTQGRVSVSCHVRFIYEKKKSFWDVRILILIYRSCLGLSFLACKHGKKQFGEFMTREKLPSSFFDGKWSQGIKTAAAQDIRRTAEKRALPRGEE